MSMLSRNLGEQTKKSIVVTCNFVSWCVGNAIGKLLRASSFPSADAAVNVAGCSSAGPQVFLDWDAPHHHIAFSVHIGCYTLLVLSMVFLRS
jgi:hypothetical protein